MKIRPAGEDWLLGEAAAAPWLVGVIEGAGGALWWPADGSVPGGLVWDAPRASGWIDAIWPGTIDALAAAGAFGPAPDDEARAEGTDGEATAIDDGSPAEETGDRHVPGRLAAAARAAALAAWRAAWWPASRIAGVPALDPRLVAGELVSALADLDGALDDDEAVARALREYTAVLVRFGEPPGDAVGDAAGLIRLVARIADDHGVEIAAATGATSRADEYALAAAGRVAASPLASGETRVDPSALPRGVVDPAGSVAWSVALGAGGAILSVTAPAAPQFADALPPTPDLRARIADIEVPLALRGDAWSGEAPVPAAFLALPAGRRSAVLFAPGFAPSSYEYSRGDVEQAPAEHPADALVRIARSRLTAGESISEREAR